jgi:hypothetical protein
MHWLRIGLFAALGTGCILADVTYDESFGSFVGRYDIEPSPLRAPAEPPAVFDDPDYSPAPFDDAGTQNFRVYIKGNKLARIGALASTIYDLDAGTVTSINREKRRYSVMTFADFERRLDKSGQGNAGIHLEVTDTGRTMDLDGETAAEYRITARKGSGGESEALAHAVYWIVPALQSAELAAFQKRCLDKYGSEYSGLCAPTEPNGFGIVARGAANLAGYPVLKIIESRMQVPMPGRMNRSPAEIYPADRAGSMRSQPARSFPPRETGTAPSYTRIVRTETRISNFVEGPVDDSKFAIPKHYKRSKSLSGN